VDVVTGATYSSNALVANARLAFNLYTAHQETVGPAPVIGWTKTVVVVLVLMAGLLAASCRHGRRGLRVLVLLLNIAVLGFWTGQFLSFSLLRGWMMNGVDPWGALSALVLVVAAVLLPFFGYRKHYCTWVCPYGALQELAFRVPVPKLKVSARTFKWLHRLRLGLLMALLFALWMGTGAVLLDYEPFGAFLVSGADLGVLAVAAGFVVLGLFVPRPWCTALCPLGMLLDLTEEAPSASGAFAENRKNKKVKEEKS